MRGSENGECEGEESSTLGSWLLYSKAPAKGGRGQWLGAIGEGAGPMATCRVRLHPWCVLTQNFHPMPRTHAASQKGPLDEADLPSFSVGVVDPG